MAGLLDIFGTSGQETMGLLGMSPEDVQRNRDSAQAQALYALAGRLFQGGRGGASIVEGLQQGQQAYRQAMQGSLQQQLQNAQIQDMLRKRQQEQMALAEQQRIQNVIKGGVTQPQEIYGEDIMGQRVGEGMTAPSFDLQRVMPQLIGSPEGRKTLTDLISTQEAMAGKTFNLAENAQLGRINSITGKTEIIATGVPKKEKEDIAGEVKEARQILGITTPVNEMTATERALVKAYIDRKEAIKSPKVQVDLKDPTAVAQAQLKTINQWQSTLKDTGDTTVAGRASAFYDAYGKAKSGNTSADGALIYNIAKVYDQTGAVQQGDVNTIIGNRSIPTNIQLFAQKLDKGGTFTPKEREDLKKIVDGIVTEREKALEPSLKVYRKLNQDQGGSPEAIINPFESIKKPKSLEEILGFGRPRGGQ